ncbi:TetR/AcrR family transcriptional regulator [Streptosporangium roseum]|uniref:TetR/AcrR family transcriptional regulator n=1 Tax=Streptosporangium roseum TaxID=2001 RepID=UPI0001A3DB61|nr:TetR/AcrR family transcriptional regulator [Streptosporangium roseum]
MRSTRERIVDAAAQVMRTQGLARATTKEIARTAGCSEALLYKHFRAKEDLFLAVLQERLPGDLPRLLATLAGEAGRNTVAGNLERVAHAAIIFYDESFPIAASIFSELRLLDGYRTAMRERSAGPQTVNLGLAAYLRAEQALGRVRPDADPEAVAALLLGACLQHAFLSHFTEVEAAGAAAGRLARNLAAGL